MKTLIPPANRTMWEAARELRDTAHRLRSVELWDLAYRLWMQAAVSKAPGTPFHMLDIRPVWLP